MAFLFSGLADTTLLIFVVIALLKISLLKDKESKGLKWITIGGIVSLLGVLAPLNDWNIFTGIRITEIVFIFPTIAFIIILIGSFKLIVELFE